MILKLAEKFDHPFSHLFIYLVTYLLRVMVSTLWRSQVKNISLYQICEEKQNILNLLPTQLQNHESEQICCWIWTNVKMDHRISQQVSGSWYENCRVNWIRVAKPLIFFKKWHHELSFSLRWALLSLYTLELWMLCKVYSNSNHCFFSMLPSACRGSSTRGQRL